MPFHAPFKVGTGANCGDGAGEEVGEGVPPSSRSQGLVEKILEQSLKKVGGKKKKNDPQNAGARKPRIDPPIFSRSPVKMKKVTMRGKRTKPSYMSDDEGDLGEQSCAPAEKGGSPAELVGGDELVGGEQEDTFMRSCSQLFAISIFQCFQEAGSILMFPGGWIEQLGRSQKTMQLRVKMSWWREKSHGWVKARYCSSQN